MGYQESYAIPKRKNSFNKLVQCASIERDNWATPELVIEFTKNHYPFKQGDKAIYFCGERYPQTLCSETDERGIQGILSNCPVKYNLIFTEYVNPLGIWEDAGEVEEMDCVKIPFKEYLASIK